MRREGWGEIVNEDSFGEVEYAPYSHLNWVKGGGASGETSGKADMCPLEFGRHSG